MSASGDTSGDTSSATADTKECPFCAETIKVRAIKVRAIKCRFCGHEFAPPPAAPSAAPAPAAPTPTPAASAPSPSTPAPASVSLEAGQILDLISQLADKSLVVYEEDGRGNGRYRLLETVRQYARDRLLESGEGPPTRARHRDQFLHLAERAKSDMHGPDAARWLDRLETEHDNLRAVLDGCVGDEPAGGDAGLRVAGALTRFWEVRGHYREGRDRLEAVLAHPGAREPTKARADALNGAGIQAAAQGDKIAARAHYTESLGIRRAIGDKAGVAGSLNNLGNLAFDQGEHETARVCFGEALALEREIGNRGGQARVLINLGNLAVRAGDLRESARLYEEARAHFAALGHVGGLLYAHNGLGHAALKRGEVAEARDQYVQALRLCRGFGDRRITADALEGLAEVALRQGQPEHAHAGMSRAAHLLGAASALRERIDVPLSGEAQQEMARHLVALREAVGESAFATALAAGRALTWEQSIEYALAEDG